MKRFREWLFNQKGEATDLLFPPLINESMIKEDTLKLRNGEHLTLGIASIADLDAIIRIQEACYFGKAPWGRIAVNTELRNKHSSFFLMMYHDSFAVSFIGLSSRQDSLHVTNIATDPRYQNNGIASFLIDQVIWIAKQLDKKQITLEVRISNKDAKRLYNKLGFKDVRIKQNYYHSNGEDAVDMVFMLDEMNGEHQVNEK